MAVIFPQRRLPRNVLVTVLVLAQFFVTAGCSRTKIGDLTTVSLEAKEQKLYERIEHFNRARYWGSSQEALGYIDAEHRVAFINTERELAAKQRIVRSEVAMVNVGETGDSAEVELEIQYFEQPTYVVKTRREKQQWKFNRFDGGWQMSQSEISEQDSVQQSDPSLSRGRMRGISSY